MRAVVFLLMLLVLTSCGRGPRRAGRYLVLENISSSMNERDFKAALIGRWEATYSQPNATNIWTLDLTADRCRLLLRDGVGRTHLFEGPYTVTLDLPPDPRRATVATIDIESKKGRVRLRQVSFGYHDSMLRSGGAVLRVNQSPYGVLKKVAE